MRFKTDTEYVVKTGHTIDGIDGSIPLEMEQELVRCKDCRRSKEPENGGLRFCMYLWAPVIEDGFCWRGERKNG